jgi:hypothetical protein
LKYRKRDLVDWLVVLSMTLLFPNELFGLKKHRQILFLKVEESNLEVQKTGDAYYSATFNFHLGGMSFTSLVI